MPIRAASEFYASQVALAARTVALVRALWRQMPNDLDGGWADQGSRIAAVVAAGQLAAAGDASEYVPLALAEQGSRVAPDAQVNVRGFAGRTSAGNALDSLLYGAVVHAKQADAQSLQERLRTGEAWLDALVHTSVSDASRDAVTAGVVARKRVQYARMASPPCCQRCAVLAGRIYRYSQGFLRHPRCNCTMLPQVVANPDAVGMDIGPDDVRDLTSKQRELLSNGADFNRVINDHQRKSGDFLPPTKVSRLAAQADRSQATDALIKAGYLAA